MKQATLVWLMVLAAVTVSGQELRVTFLGTGAPRPSFERYGPSILVEAGDERLLVDPSWGLRERIMQVGSFDLEYSPLSQRYVVRNLNSGDQDSFATLYSALNNLGRIQGLPLIDDSLLEGDRYRVRIRALLNTQQYSAPLRLLFFWRDQWQLESEWSEWLLER